MKSTTEWIMSATYGPDHEMVQDVYLESVKNTCARWLTPLIALLVPSSSHEHHRSLVNSFPTNVCLLCFANDFQECNTYRYTYFQHNAEPLLLSVKHQNA